GAPAGAARRAGGGGVRGCERGREPRPAPGATARCRIINASPGSVPRYFQDRHDETQLLAKLIEDPAIRLCFVVGRGGVGKTTFVCRLLGTIASRAPAGAENVPDAPGVVHPTPARTRRLPRPNLYADLSSLVPGPRAAELAALYASPHATTRAKMLELLAAIPPGRVLVLLDNFEDVVDGQQLAVRDAELLDALRAVLSAP